MKTPTTATFALLATLLVAGFATQASGAGPTVTVGPDGARAGASALSLNITGSTEADEIGITLDGPQTQYVITSTHPINAGPPCTSTSTFEVRCPASQITSFQGSLLDGNDTMRIGPSVKAPGTVRGGAGLDDLIGGSASDTMFGASGSDRLVGNKGQDTMEGGTGRDILNGGEGRDVLRGGKGRDRLRGGPGRDAEQQ